MNKKAAIIVSVLIILVTVLMGCGEPANAVCDGCHKQKYCGFYHVYSPYGEVRDYALCKSCYKDYELSTAMLGGRIEKYEK